jgi:hypothetical protein
MTNEPELHRQTTLDALFDTLEAEIARADEPDRAWMTSGLAALKRLRDTKPLADELAARHYSSDREQAALIAQTSLDFLGPAHEMPEEPIPVPPDVYPLTHRPLGHPQVLITWSAWAERGRGDEWAATAQWLRQLHEHSHCHAWSIVLEEGTVGRPFALYLQGFEAQAHMYTVDPSVTEASFGWFQHSEEIGAPHEQVLVAALEAVCPVVGAANALAIGVEPVPRLQLDQESWREDVRALIAAAHMIIVRVATISDGLRWELAQIRDLDKAASTVIVLADGPNDDLAWLWIPDDQRRVEAPETPDPDDPAFAEFDRVVIERELDLANLLQESSFGDLLRDAARLTSAAERFDPVQYVQGAVGGALMRFDEGDRQQGTELLHAALIVARHYHLSDYEVLVLTLLAEAHAIGGDFELAQRALSAALLKSDTSE